MLSRPSSKSNSPVGILKSKVVKNAKFTIAENNQSLPAIPNHEPKKQVDNQSRRQTILPPVAIQKEPDQFKPGIAKKTTGKMDNFVARRKERLEQMDE